MLAPVLTLNARARLLRNITQKMHTCQTLFFLQYCCFGIADCFFRLNELHFSLSDYQQALEMDNSDWSVRCRLSIVFNEFGILEYYDRHYLDAIDHLTTSIHYNPRIGAYYLSRARARYMIEVLQLNIFGS